jgi:hypothetical protein
VLASPILRQRVKGLSPSSAWCTNYLDSVLNLLFTRFVDVPALRAQQRERLRHPLNTCAFDGSPVKGSSNGNNSEKESFQISFEKVRSLFALFTAVVAVGTVTSRRGRSLLELCLCKVVTYELREVSKHSSSTRIAGVVTTLEVKAERGAQHIKDRMEGDLTFRRRQSISGGQPTAGAAAGGTISEAGTFETRFTKTERMLAQLCEKLDSMAHHHPSRNTAVIEQLSELSTSQDKMRAAIEDVLKAHVAASTSPSTHRGGNHAGPSHKARGKQHFVGGTWA